MQNLKVLGGASGNSVAPVIEGIFFAKNNGANVINMSLGWTGRVQGVSEQIQDAYDNLSLVICAAAGNESQKNTSNVYPASDYGVSG
jgi:Subtilase family